MANVKNEPLSLKLGFYAVFGSLITNPLSDWSRHYEFFKSDSGFVISEPREPPYTNFHKNWKFFEIAFRHFDLRNTDSESEIKTNYRPKYWNCHFVL